MRIVGYRDVDFVKDGRRILGVSFFLSHPIEKYGKGDAVDKVFVRSDVLENSGISDCISIGSEIDIVYDRFGKVRNIILL